MQKGGWWEVGALGTDRAIKRRILREMLTHYAASWKTGERKPGEQSAGLPGSRPLQQLP